MPVFLRVALIFLLVALLAGGIAMLGNQLGRKIGRKKMTIFGMRPRHTSIFITTVTGSLIAVLTLGIAMVASQDVRDLITGSQERLKKLQQRERELVVRVQQLAEEVRVGSVVWKYEERVALNTLQPGADERTVTNTIRAMLARANQLSLKKNNEIALSREDEQFPLDTVLVQYTEEESRQWVPEYSNLKEPIGLWIVVKKNCLYRDTVPVTVESFPVNLLFKKGETVYEAELSQSDFLLDWHVFLEEISKAALIKDMIPVDGALGAEISAENLRLISRAFEESDGKIRLSAVANRDLYQSSNLDVSIEVKP